VIIDDLLVGGDILVGGRLLLLWDCDELICMDGTIFEMNRGG
jgi:hypothetical protein